MVRKDLLRKRCAKRRIDELIHDHLALVGKSPHVLGALERLLAYASSYTDLLSPMPLGGRPSWARAACFLKGLVALAKNHNDWVRDVASWEPTGHCPLRQFGSLARHLLAHYGVPHFMDLVWFIASSKDARQKQKWYRHIGRSGGIRGADIPLRLTKKI